MNEISFTSGRDRCAAWHFNANGEAFAIRAECRAW